MNCAYHKDQPVHGVCSTCGRPICEDCLVDLKGHAHCKPCLEARMRQPTREINSFVRFVLSVVPGVGHLYMGLFQRGLQLMVITALGVLLLAMIEPLLGFYIPASIFFSIFDAREAHLRIGQGLEVEDKGFFDLQKIQMHWHPRYIGYALIVIGAVAIFNTVVGDMLRLLFPPAIYHKLAATIRGLTMGGLAIGAGFWMLRRTSSDFNR